MYEASLAGMLVCSLVKAVSSPSIAGDIMAKDLSIMAPATSQLRKVFQCRDGMILSRLAEGIDYVAAGESGGRWYRF